MSQPQNALPSSSCRIKPKITFKKLRGSSNTVIFKSPDTNIFTSGESTMSTLEGIIHENQHVGSPIYLVDQEINEQEPSDRSHKSYQNMFVEAQPSPHAVYKSTLANLSDGLATLNEGEYVQWDSCNEQKQQQATVLSQKSIDHSGRKQRPMSVHMYAPPGTCNNSRMETPIGRDRSPYRSVNKAHARIVRNCGAGEVDFVYRRNYDSVLPSSQSQIHKGKDLRWKGSGSMNEDLEILKTEESQQETVKKINRENTECAPVVVLKERYQRSSSVKNRRPLTQEFEEWKVILMGRKEALAEKKEQIKKEKLAQQDAKKEDMVLPKLNIGGENLGNSTKQETEKDPIFISKHTTRFGEMRKTKLKWGGGRPMTGQKKALSINVKENRENVLDKSNSRKDSQEIAVQTLEIQKNPKEMKPIAKLASHHGSASMIIWDEETLLQNMEQRYNEQTEHNEKLQSDQWKQRCLMPKMKVKQDLIMKKQMMLMQQKAKSRAESRDRSRDRSAEVKYDVDKVIKGYRETVNRIGMEGYYSCGNDASTTEACTAQNILDLRLKTLEERYVSHGKEQRRSLDQKRLSRSSLGGEQEGSKSKGREGSGKLMKVNFVMNTNLKKAGMSVRHVV